MLILIKFITILQIFFQHTIGEMAQQRGFIIFISIGWILKFLEQNK